MGLDLEYLNGQTPLDEDEKEDLLIDTISTQGELDQFEQKNIEQALQWTLSRKFTAKVIFSEAFIKNIHHRMFGEVWKWAGYFRKTNKNIGVDKSQISVALLNLLNDVTYWIDHKNFPPDDIAIRFKHRIVSIHCFPNGNGRHSRLMADIIIEKIFNLPVFSWGTTTLLSEGDNRTAYINALKAADNGDYNLLLAFARS
ncbi:MAG: mobile mystery protein B [bacterium]|nr:mobile mystery protein B [bacterium]